MRSSISVIFFVSVVGLLIVKTHAENVLSRQKRFLRRDFLNPLSDGLFGLSENVRDFSDQIASQASAAVQQVVPQATRAVAGLSTWGRNVGAQMAGGLQKRGMIRVPLEREVEGEDEVETFDPPQVEQPQRRPTGMGLVPFPSLFSFGLMTPWWDGPNVCTERNEIKEPEQDSAEVPGFSFNFETTRCIPSDTAYSCTRKIQSNGERKTVVIRRQCCHGFVRRKDGRPGCSVLKMDNLMDTMKSLKMGKFLLWVEHAGLSDRLTTENLTLFVPSNEAVVDFEDESEDNEISAINPVKRLVDTTSIVAGHIVQGFHNTDLLENEELLQTMDGEGQIRINKYKPENEIVTANCVPVSGKNHFATNGILHLTGKVLPRTTSTVGEMIEVDEAFTQFKNLMLKSDMLSELKKKDDPWTVFVPTDEAFQKLPNSLRKQIESGEGCIQSILDHHVVRGTVCSSAVVSQVKVRNVLRNDLQMTKDETDELRVEGALLQMKDVLGTNGVIHVIDKVLIPPQARTLLKALEEEDRKDLLELIALANMESQLEEAQNVTFFVPSKQALKALSNETREAMLSDPEFLKQVLQHHLIQANAPSRTFGENQKFTTLNGHNVHLKLQEMFPGIVTAATVQCAYVVSHDNQACGSVMHGISKVLMPPKGSIVDALKSMEGHETVLKLLKNTDLETKLSESGPFTFLAPDNEAFEKLRDPTVEELLQNNTLAEEILKLHILPEVLCCNGVGHGSVFHHQYVRALDGSVLHTHRTVGDRVRFGRARVSTCDVPATNGLVHSINRVIQPERPRSVLFGMDLFPFF